MKSIFKGWKTYTPSPSGTKEENFVGCNATKSITAL